METAGVSTSSSAGPSSSSVPSSSASAAAAALAAAMAAVGRQTGAPALIPTDLILSATSAFQIPSSQLSPMSLLRAVTHTQQGGGGISFAQPQPHQHHYEMKPPLLPQAVQEERVVPGTAATKQEASSSSTSPIEELPPRQLVPACSICGADSTGIHFGVEACAACSAFFRRTVVLAKNYACSKHSDCIVLKDSPGSQKCRACRFQKCIRVGMDRSAVQHRRDAIGKYSTIVKQECGSPGDYSQQQPGPSHVNGDCLSPATPRSAQLESRTSVLDEFVRCHEVLSAKRKLFYTNTSLSDVFDQEAHLEPVELKNFGECMYQLWRIEPRLCADFVSGNAFLRPLPSGEKCKLFKNFMLTFQAVEEPYLTWKFGGLEKQWWIMPNRTYLDFSRCDDYFADEKIMKALNLDKKTAIKLFLPSFQHAMDIVGHQMQLLDISYTEMVGLAAVLLLDPSTPELEPATRDVVTDLRNRVMRDLMVAYDNEASDRDPPEVRLGNLLLIISSIRLHAHKSKENMQMLQVFDMVPRDNLFAELVGL